MKLIGLLCINLLVVNMIVSLSLEDRADSKVERILSLNYQDQKFQVISKLGNPISKNDQKWHYRYSGVNAVIVSWNEDRLFSARAEFSAPISLSQFKIHSKVFLLESRQNWAKIAVPAMGYQIELNGGGDVISLEIKKPWRARGSAYQLSTLLIDLGLVPKLVMRGQDH